MSKKKKIKLTKVGLPPETAVYTGQAEVEQSIVTIVQYNSAEYKEKSLKGSTFPLPTVEKVTWYDVRGLNDNVLIERIQQIFEVHPLAIEDILNTSQRPKWEDYTNGIFIIIHALRYDKRIGDSVTEQVSFYLGKDVLLTFQEDTDDLFLPIRERLQRGLGKIKHKGVDFLAYTLLDYIVDGYINVLEKLEDEIVTIEIEILTNFTPSVRSDIYRLKRQLTEIRRAALPLRDVVGRFSREQGEFIDPANQVYIRDLYDHVVRVIESVENQRDMLNNMNDLFNSEQTNQTNHIFKVLTVISVIFIPPTFIVGVYGTNFDVLPELHFPHAYFLMWGAMVSLAIAQLIFFRWKKWL